MQGLGMGGALSLVLIVQVTAEEVHRSYYKPRHKPRLRWSGKLIGFGDWPVGFLEALETM